MTSCGPKTLRRRRRDVLPRAPIRICPSEEVRVSQILVHDEAAARRIAAEAKPGANESQVVSRSGRTLFGKTPIPNRARADLTFFDRKTTREPRPWSSRFRHVSGQRRGRPHRV